jgi:hypothetical protein
MAQPSLYEWQKYVENHQLAYVILARGHKELSEMVETSLN